MPVLLTDDQPNHDSRQLSPEELDRLDAVTIAETVWIGDERVVIRYPAFDKRKKLAA